MSMYFSSVGRSTIFEVVSNVRVEILCSENKSIKFIWNSLIKRLNTENLNYSD